MTTNPAISPSVNSLQPEIPQQGYPSDRVIQELTGGLVRIHRRVEIYEADGTTKFNIPNWNARLVDGAVTVDRERDEKRMCDLTLDNTDKALKNDPYKGFYYDKILKIYWGIRYYDYTLKKWRRWETPLGVFMIDRIDEDRFPNAVKVTGRDLSKKCIVSKLSQTLSFPQGASIESMIKSMGANAGVKQFLLPVTGNAYAQDLVFTRGTARWDVMKQLADVIGYELYFMPDGTLTMRPYPDPTLTPVSWSFTQDLGGTLCSYSKSSNDSNIFNHIIVTGAALGAEPDELGGAITTTSTSEVVFAEARNTDPASPTSITRLGDRVKPYSSDYFTTAAAAQDYADTMLRIASLEEYTISFNSLIIPWIDAGDIVEIEQPDDDKYTPSRFLLSSYTVPLGLGPMTCVGKRVTVVGTKQKWEYQ